MPNLWHFLSGLAVVVGIIVFARWLAGDMGEPQERGREKR